MKKYPVEHEITINYQGRPYSGSYHVQSKTVTVSLGTRTMSTHLGSRLAPQLASTLLREMIDGGASEDS